MSASADDLIRLGVPPEQAKIEGVIPAAVTCAGTTAGTATVMTGTLCNLTTGASATGAKLPAFPAGRSVIVNTTSATTAKVYPPSGGTINGGSADASIDIAQNKTAIFYYYTNLTIFSILTA